MNLIRKNTSDSVEYLEFNFFQLNEDDFKVRLKADEVQQFPQFCSLLVNLHSIKLHDFCC
jgi:hypothetical protein